MFFTLTALPALVLPARAQSPMFNQRDDKYRLLGLKRSKETYEVAKRDFERQQTLFDKGLISQSELDRSRNSMADAEVNYQQSLLAVLFETQYVTVNKAIKYQAKDGGKHVRLTLANASGGTEELQKLVNIDDKLFRSLQPDVVNYVYASLLNADGSIISEPYEQKIEELTFGHPRELDFTLLQEVDAVTVNLTYGNGTTRSMKIFLKKDSSQRKVLVQSEQFSQEADMGKSASYDLRLEQFSSSSDPFSLEVVNLPQQITHYFKDPSSDARLTQVRFTESSNSRKAALVVSLPDRPSEEVAMEKTLPFYVLVVPAGRLGELNALSGKRLSQEDIEKLNVGYVRLELTPRGKGKLLVRAQQMLYTIRSGDKAEMTLDIVNEGTQPLQNIELKPDAPLNWTRDVEPKLIPLLGVGEEKKVIITCVPPAGVSVGRYDVRIQTYALSGTEPVTAEDKIMTVEIAAGTNILGTAIIVLLIIGAVGSIVVFGIRLAKK
jgi:uncharacterized membrane protein